MRIAYVEIKNFRKLLAVRIDLAKETTLLVGANNSGKTSAMLAIRQFLVASSSSKFRLNDFTLCQWPKINAIGSTWKRKKGEPDPSGLMLNDWFDTAPTLDLWMHIEDGEIHRVCKLIPTLDWTAGLLGVRLRFQPKDPEKLRKDYLAALEATERLKAAAGKGGNQQFVTKLWPENMTAFLDRELHSYFAVQAYTLDPSKILDPEDGIARPQAIPIDQEPVDGANLKGLIRVNEINAQRIFGDESDGGDGLRQDARSAQQLSVQLRNYYKTHLDPFKNPNPSDLEALDAIEKAQKAFDDRLAAGFKAALEEVQGLGYPGVTDPKLKISTRLKPVEGLDHDAAVQYEIEAISEDSAAPSLTLPEHFNGLGYQNLVSMIFRLISFRDAWMRVGKAGTGPLETEVPPLHLVLVEEPEAHLHAQVQQVFINKAYRVLRAHPDLGKCQQLHTQLVVSTHSSHVAHEIDFSCLRYFRRLPAGLKAPIPVSTVVNLSEVFGKENDTQRFATRYLKAQHCDLFFADAAILIEGPAERMLVPHFIRLYPTLSQRYITLLEIGGSHAHRLRPLIDELHLLTVVITDLDAVGKTSGSSEPPRRAKEQVTNNDTLKNWVPQSANIDDLCDLADNKKVCSDDGRLFAVRVAYQIPVKVALKTEVPAEVIPNTFEDALVFENLAFFAGLQGTGLVRKFKDAIQKSAAPQALGDSMFEALRTGKKAEFALDVVAAKEFGNLKVPTYIAQALAWLEKRLVERPPEAAPAVAAEGTAV
jgi:predicted ATP-dependent endonuclease of OLD family